MELNIVNFKTAAKAGKQTLSDESFAHDFNGSLVHQIVNAYLAGARQGSKAQKNRSDVRGGGRKPWRQKGTGRARAGTIRSPLWRSGGVTFAARPRDYSQKVNKKMMRGAMRSIWSELLRQDRLVVVDEITLDEVKTKTLVALLKGLGVEKGLIIVDELDKHLTLSACNVPHLEVLTTSEINPLSLVANEKVLITVAALKRVEERLA